MLANPLFFFSLHKANLDNFFCMIFIVSDIYRIIVLLLLVICNYGVCPHKYACWSLNSQHLRIWPYLKIESSQGQSRDTAVWVGFGQTRRGASWKGRSAVKAEVSAKLIPAKQQQRLSVNHQKLEERHETDPSSQPQKEPTLQTPASWWNRRNCGTINLCCVKAIRFVVVCYSRYSKLTYLHKVC